MEHLGEKILTGRLTIPGHELEFIDELYGGDQEGQGFPTACLSSGQNISTNRTKEKRHFIIHSDDWHKLWWPREICQVRHTHGTFVPNLQTHQENVTYLPSNRGRILLCWISVMCSKPMSFTPFSVFSLTSPAREANDVSSNAPEKHACQKVRVKHKRTEWILESRFYFKTSQHTKYMRHEVEGCKWEDKKACCLKAKRDLIMVHWPNTGQRTLRNIFTHS